jgi:hypothetical protein
MEQDKPEPLNSRARDLFEWIKDQDKLTVERLQAHMRHINEHYHKLYSKEQKTND